MALNPYQIFTDFNSDGPKESFREFLGYFVKQFWPFVNTQIEKLYLARMDYPLIVFPFYLLAILGFWFFWQKPSPKTAIWAAIPAGLLFYMYFHFWVYWIVVLGILFIYSLVNYKKDPVLGKNFLILVGIITLIAAPYFINYFEFRGQSGIQDFVYRLGIAEGRTLGLATMGFTYLFYIIVGIAVYFTYFKTDRHRAILFWGILAGMFVVWNIQLIIGYVPVPNNWRRTISPLLFIMLFNLIYDWAQIAAQKWSWPNLNSKKIILIGVTILSVLVVSKKVINGYEIFRNPESRIINASIFSKDIYDSWKWINANLAGEPKIISDSFITSLYLPVYTAARPFLAVGNLTPAPTKEIEDRFLISARLLGVTDKTLRGMLEHNLPIPCQISDPKCPPNTEDNIRKVVWHLYSQYFRRDNFDGYLAKPSTITKTYIDNLADRYKKITPSWNNLAADYLYYGPWERQFSQLNLKQNKNLKLVYENPAVQIYQVLH